MDNHEIVCSCMNVSVQDLKDAIKNGAKSFEEVQEVTNVGTGCGGCVENVKNLIEELLEK